MINFIDRALEQYLREQVPLPESSIGVSFDTPDKDWGAALNRPTVNAFLWDVSRATRSTTTGLAQRREDESIQRRRANPQAALHYMITAWATETRDEHQVLGAILQAVLRRSTLPADSLPAGITDGLCQLAMEAPEHRVPGEFWSALGGRLKPGIQLRVTVPMPVYDWVTVAAPPTSLDLGVDSIRPKAPAPAAKGRWAPADGTNTRRMKRNGTVSVERRADEAPGAEPT